MTDRNDLMTQEQRDQLEVGWRGSVGLITREMFDRLSISHTKAEQLIDRMYDSPGMALSAIRQALHTVLAQIDSGYPVYTETEHLKPVAATLLPARSESSMVWMRKALQTRTGLYVDDELERYLDTCWTRETGPAPECPCVALLVKRDISEFYLQRELPRGRASTFVSIAGVILARLEGVANLFALHVSRTHFFVRDEKAEEIIVTAEHLSGDSELHLSYRMGADGSFYLAGDHIVCPGMALLGGLGEDFASLK